MNRSPRVRPNHVHIHAARAGALTLSMMAASTMAAALFAFVTATATPWGLAAQTADAEVTFARDVAPILQQSCQSCHRPGSVAPMSLITYEEVRPWAMIIKERTAIRDRMGAMPPWFIERDVGIQEFRNDQSLSDGEIALLAAWADGGAPLGDPADMPPPLEFAGENEWEIGQPDLIVDLPPYTMEARAPDWWGMIPPVPTGLTEDRYVAAIEVKEISDVEGGLGGNFIFHHAILASIDPRGSTDGGWPIHEVGRNAEFFDPEAGRLLSAGSQFLIPGAHLNSNAQTTTAHLRLGFKFHPPEYEPRHRVTLLTFGNGEIDLRPMETGQEVHLYTTLQQNMKITTFEPHMHAAGVRMCVEAIWGDRSETLSCAGYDHNWVKVYNYAEHATPLLPRGTVLRVTAYFDTTPNNPNVIDPRNWGGLGHRSIDNMAIVFLPGIPLGDEAFEAEVAIRRERLGLAPGEGALGCPLCASDERPVEAAASLPDDVRAPERPLRGANVAPVYEGFERNPDGSFDLLFGYFNRNWEEELHVPVGPDNRIEPGGPDGAQPTRFLPQRNQFVFRVRVPADFGDQEVVWTLTTNGVTERAYGTLRPEYAVDEVVMSANFGAGGQTGFHPSLVGNLPPELTVENDLRLTARVGEPVTLTAVVTDDGKPDRRSIPASAAGQSQFVPNSATGLRFSWFHYRGPGEVAFDPPQTRVWQDTRDASSPWAAGWVTPPVPADNRWVVRATFSEPGTHVLRALAHDGALLEYEDVTVVVTP